MWLPLTLLEEDKGDGDPSMPKPQTFGGSCPSSPLFPCEHEAGLLQAPFCIWGWQWVFRAIPLGTRFYSLSKSKDTIKTTNQRTIKGTNNSTLLWRGCHWTGSFCSSLFLLWPWMQKSSSWCLLRPLEAEPSQQAGSSQRERDLQTKYFVFLSGLTQRLTMFSLVLTSILPTKVSSHICFPWRRRTLAPVSPSDNLLKLDAGFCWVSMSSPVY